MIQVAGSGLRIWREALDLLFPIGCVGCGNYTGNGQAASASAKASADTAGNRDHTTAWLCADCTTSLTPDRPRCIVCGAASPSGRTCYRCLPATPLAGVLAVGPYRDPTLQAAIKALKFHGVRDLAAVLGDLLAHRMSATLNAELGTRNLTVLVPLPLHPRRERSRGFNQACLLAEAASARLGLPVADLLVRTRATSPQTSILESPRARARNVAGAFASLLPTADCPLPTRVILIDDVLTTGATMTEAASVLREAGAEEIWAAVVARG